MTEATVSPDSCSIDELIEKVESYVRSYMAKYDASHDYSHIERVHSLAKTLFQSESALHPDAQFDETLITLGALLHDVGDRKYLLPEQDPSSMVSSFLISAGAPTDLATRIQELVSHVSFSTEKRDPEQVRTVLERIPELAIVQDADRLDAIGAVGIARCFAFTASKGEENLQDAIEHFTEKLETLEGMMKTESGRKMATQRTVRLKTFRSWWEDEIGGPKFSTSSNS